MSNHQEKLKCGQRYIYIVIMRSKNAGALGNGCYHFPYLSDGREKFPPNGGASMHTWHSILWYESATKQFIEKTVILLCFPS